MRERVISKYEEHRRVRFKHAVAREIAMLRAEYVKMYPAKAWRVNKEKFNEHGNR